MAETNEAWFERASRVLPGGVDSPVRSFASVGGTPYTVAFGAGATVTDVEGTTYLDYVQSYGASLLGHADPSVLKAIESVAASGTTFGAPTRHETLLAEAITERVTGLEQVRFVSSGTEAAMSAVRLARGATGRNKLVKFDGCYHGHADALLAAAGSGVLALGLPRSAGVPAGAVADTVVAPYNVVPTLDDAVACVVVEPVAANMGLVAPAHGFLEGLRRECDRVGALLIFDEVITGFRLAPTAASELVGVVPDLWCFGKVIGGGLPVGAFGGARAVMDELAPRGAVYQAGTLSGNPVAMAAGLAVLEAASADRYAELAEQVARLADGLEAALLDAGIAACAPRHGTLASLFVGHGHERLASPHDLEQVRAINGSGRYAGIFHELLARGVAFAPGAYEVLFCSFAHDAASITRTIEVAHDAAAALRGRDA
ncbi:MAG TPA: glutamate-1-semialdehyde 2,1-aminomutase [Acidimicrobiales bacterium]|nr:glutamate-1-semialdehyde 2,1-aminomutase [Acidimicrobiales bacterium]